MKKRVFSLFVFLIMLFMVGCSNDTPDPIDPTNNEDGKIVLTFVSDSIVEKSVEYTNNLEEYVPVKEGFDFVCWTIDGQDIDWDSFEKTLSIFYQKSIATEISLSARWKRHEYTINLNVNGGEELEPLKVEYKKSVSALPVPTKPDYTFLGWYSDEALTTEFDVTTSVEKDFTIYAKWIESQFKITYDTDGGTSVDPTIIDYNTALTSLPVVEKTGYIFKGWYSDKEMTKEYDLSTLIDKNITIYAKWEIIKLTVKYMQSSFPDATVDYGTGIANLPVATKEDHEFKGWYYDQALENQYKAGDPITENLTLYPKFSKLTYTVKFETNGGAELEDADIIRDTKLGNITTTRIGYRFKGWFKDSGLTVPFGFSDIVSENMTLYAGWEAIEYTITLNYCSPNSELTINNMLDEPIIAKYGNTLTIATPSISGYKFEGWYTSTSYTTKWTDEDTVNKSMTLYAKWSVITYTIQFETFVGIAVKDVVVKAGEKATRPANPTRSGYVFRGWFTDSSCTDGNQWDWNTVVTKDMTLYAKWQASLG